MKKKVIRAKRKLVTPKDCAFCKEAKLPYFGEIDMLQRFLTERGKIVARSRSGICAMHQRDLAKQIKYARHLSLLPFTARD